MSINVAKRSIVINVAVPGGGRDFLVSEADWLRYLGNPDAFAAALHRLSENEYAEWIQLDGMALCGCKTKKGSLCKNPVSGLQLSADEWRAKHRELACTIHSESN